MGFVLLFGALKEQKEVANTHRSIIPIALSERKLLGSLFPRVLPWVGIVLLFCALKEQKEVANTHRIIIPIALSERKILGSLFPRVLPWAVFLLGLRPAFTHNIDCCTTP